MTKSQAFSRARLLISAVAMGSVVAILMPTDATIIRNNFIAPAHAQASFSVGFDSFHDALAPYGDWVYSDRWGLVWLPDAGADFQPYFTDGHWAPTREYGWVWASDYEWGDITFHYGRWVNDPYDGWMWVPGYMWGPGWVVWRASPSYMGWMPLPPDDDFLRGNETTSLHFSFGGQGFDDLDGYYGYARWYGGDYNEDRFARNWVFIDANHFSDRNYRTYAVREPSQITNVIRQTRNVTNYTVVNNYVVNRSVAAAGQQQASNRPAPRPAAQILRRPASISSVKTAQTAERRGIQEAPRGKGEAGSAPKPAPAIAQNLSERMRRGSGSGRLFTRATINNASSNNAPGNAPGADQSAQPPQKLPQATANQKPSTQRNAEQRNAQQRDNRAGQNTNDAQRPDDQRRQNDQRVDQKRAEDQRQAAEQQKTNAQRQNAQGAQQQRAEDQRQQKTNAQRQNAQRAQQQRADEQRQSDQRTQQERVNQTQKQPTRGEPAVITNRQQQASPPQDNRVHNREDARKPQRDHDDN